jgi:hypothetical protein
VKIDRTNGGYGVNLNTADRLGRARDFVYGNARQIERAQFEVVFDGAPPQRLVAALEVYRNADGGFGHALEPDLRTPASQPLHTETALMILKDAGVRRLEVAEGCYRFIASVADGGALPAFLPGALDYPAAAHWHSGFGAAPTLDRTLGMVGLLAWHGVRNAWLDATTATCARYLDGAHIGEAHHLHYAFLFAAYALDGAERSNALGRLRRMLDGADFFVPETPVRRYGLTPLRFVPTPDHPSRTLFDDALLKRHLDALVEAQTDDGGWPIYFQPPSEGAVIEWRGVWTLDALLTLRAWGRL